MNLLNNYKYVTYLIGSMEAPAEGDDGGSKREIIETELLKRGVFALNPVTLEKEKTGMTTEHAKVYMRDCLNENKLSEFKKMSKEIWKGKDIYNKKDGLIHLPGDFDYVVMSDWITCLYQENDKPCGTFFELGVAFDNNIPVYLISNVPANKLSMSFLQGVYGSGGQVFSDMGLYLNFIENEYKLIN